MLGSRKLTQALGVALLGFALSATMTPVRGAEPFVDLLARGDLSGWVEEQHNRFQNTNPGRTTWKLEDGVLLCDGSAGNTGFLRYDQELADFELLLEYRAAPGTNSGVTFRAPPYTGRDTPANTGFEFQIQEDSGQEPATWSSGSLYKILPPLESAARPAGEWNSLRILCEGPMILAELNGRKVQDIDQSELEVAQDRPRSGYIAFQNHGGDIAFRNVRLRQITRPARNLIRLNDDGGWCWFQDERVIVHDGKIILGSVASGHRDASRKGNIEATTYDISTGETKVAVLHANLELDDHASPTFHVRADGRILAVYAKHGSENHFYHRVSAGPGDATRWREERNFTPSDSTRITYSNLHFLARENGGRGRLYNFYRGLDDSFKPSYAYSDDDGESWTSGNVFIQVPTEFRHRPYVKYASNGADTVHVFYTDGHPRNYDNSVYHVFYRDGMLHRSGGEAIRPLTEGLREPSEGTLVFQGDPDNVAWVIDIQTDASGRPYGIFSVQKDSAGLEPRTGGEDHRYFFARWTGSAWTTHEIAYAGTRLYAGEDDYTGLAALDPDDPQVLYISTDAHPTSGEPLVSKTDGQRHYEIYRGTTIDNGAHWSWTAITRDSTSDNIRPIVPKWNREQTALLWLRGAYRAYTDYDLEVVGLLTGLGN